MRTPYNNGKIKIGEFYEPPKYVEQDWDMLEIQKWMIGNPEKLRQEYWTNLVFTIIGCFIVLLVVLRYVKN